MNYRDLTFTKDSCFLVTGGAGFIGSNIVEALLDMGYRVRVLDDYSTGKEENLQGFTENPSFELVEGSICEFDTCKCAVEDIDYVIHQAAWGAIPRSIKMPLQYDIINVHGTLNMMQASVEQGVKKFVYASSSSVYGDATELPKVEGREGRLLAPYPITKAVNELYAKNYYDLYGLPTVGLRYFNVFGKRQDPKSAYAAVVPVFVKHLLEDRQATINGNGSYSRDFTYIENVIEANLKACLSSDNASGEVFNIAFGNSITIQRLYDILAGLLGKDIKPKYGPVRPGDIPHSLADINKAKRLLGYTPEYSVEQGLELAVDWYVDNLG